MEITEDWFLLQSKVRQETRASQLLECQGYNVYCPEVWVDRSKNLRKKVGLEPLFPGYLFIKLDLETTNWTAIRSTRGVRDFVRFGERTAVVDKKIVDDIKNRTDLGENKVSNEIDLAPGTEVRLTKGCFDGLNAIYQHKSGRDRVVVLISLMGRLSRATVSIDSLQLVKR